MANGSRDWDTNGTKADKKKERDWEALRPEPEDLKKVGVRERGLIMTTAKTLKKRREELDKALKESE